MATTIVPRREVWKPAAEAGVQESDNNRRLVALFMLLSRRRSGGLLFYVLNVDEGSQVWLIIYTGPSAWSG